MNCYKTTVDLKIYHHAVKSKLHLNIQKPPFSTTHGFITSFFYRKPFNYIIWLWIIIFSHNNSNKHLGRKRKRKKRGEEERKKIRENN